MPFKLVFRRGNNILKSCFVAQIQLLDGSVTECSRLVESTGQEYLEEVARKLGLTETQYFGLWFHSKSQLQRWVESEKSLKKQLDKFANEPLLHFGVKFYVPSFSPLEHEVTRYQYYLQLKKDVLDGRLPCPLAKAIKLAGLDVQANYGDLIQIQSHDFLTEGVLFPVTWTRMDDMVLEECTQKVAEEHRGFCGLSAAEAQLQYIKEAEKLDGLGEELFAVKDTHTNDVFLGVSVMGVFVKHRNGRTIRHPRWDEIGNITHSKSAVSVEITSRDDTITFHTDDIEVSKYISRLFTAKHKFYKQNKTTEPAYSPVPIRRRATWNHTSVQRPSSFVPHCQETQSSQDNIYHSYQSESSLDCYPPELLNGTVLNGATYRTSSSSSLSRSQTFGDVMRSDYIPSQRHSAIIPPYRPSPDYDSVMWHKRLAPPPTAHSQSLRSLNTCVYRQTDSLVNSQPEMRHWAKFPQPYGHMAPPASSGVLIAPPASQEATGDIFHTVSTPELANGKPQGHPDYSTMLKKHLTRPPPSYPSYSTPDLASHHLSRVGGSSPELVPRRVRTSVRTFRPESSINIGRQSWQDASERQAALSKRHSLEVMSSMVQDMEALTRRTLNAPLPRRNTLKEQVKATPPPIDPLLQPFRHKKNPSDATVLIHSTDSEGDIEDEDQDEPTSLRTPTPRLQFPMSAQLKAALARIPSKPPPEYPGPAKAIRNRTIRSEENRAAQEAKATAQRNQDQTNLGPSVSEPDLTIVKQRVKKQGVKERPVSEMFSIKDSIVEREIKQRTLERQRTAVDSVHQESISYRTSVDEQTLQPKLSEWKLDEDHLHSEYEQIPRWSGDRAATTASLTDNKERNRCLEVLPYEENRVELVPTRDNITGYINASHIKVLNQGREWHYIATQGPLPRTCQDFWQMVWDQGVNVIAMVTAEEEGSSYRYWPQVGPKLDSTTYGKFKITTKSCTGAKYYATTRLKVKNLLSGQERTVWHLQYTQWPVGGCPDIQGFYSYLEEIQSVRHHTNRILDTSRSLNPPVVVHCSNGAGWTGVVILAELMIDCLKHNQSMDISTMLGHLRQQRMLMIQSLSQYKFVYQLLVNFLKSSRLI